LRFCSTAHAIISKPVQPDSPSPTDFPRAPEIPAPAGSYHLIGRRTDRENRRLFQTGLWLVIAGGAVLGFRANVEDVLHLYLGLTIYALALLPGLLWLRQGGSRFPVFEPMMALCASGYAVPLLNGHEQLGMYPVGTVTQAGIGVIAYQLAAILTYLSVRGRPGRSRFWTESILTHKVESLVSYGIVISTCYMAVANFTSWIPRDLESVARAAFNGISILCTFVTAQRWGRGELKTHEQWTFGVTLSLQLLIMASTLLLISSLTLCGIGLLGYLSAGRRIPWVAIGALFVIFAVLHNGKTRMREIYWEELDRPALKLTSTPAFFAEWIEHGLNAPVLAEDGEKRSASSRLLERTSLLHMLCMVVHFTPDRQPYLAGETYGYVLPQLVPRFAWPDKPRSHIGTYRLSIYYGLQDEDATQKTTIAFGLPAEAYANFGFAGLAGLGALFGFVFRKLQHLGSQSPMFSLAGLMMIILCAWSLNAELTMAAWVSSLYQALIVTLGIPLVLRSLLGT
jgi:hypothetical protein